MHRANQRNPISTLFWIRCFAKDRLKCLFSIRNAIPLKNKKKRDAYDARFGLVVKERLGRLNQDVRMLRKDHREFGGQRRQDLLFIKEECQRGYRKGEEME